AVGALGAEPRHVWSLQLPFEDVVLADDLHAGALIEAVRSGQAVGVDAERRAAEPGLLELVKRVHQQCATESAPAPRPPHSDDRDPRDVRLGLALVAERDAGHLAARLGDEPEVEPELRLADERVLPLLERRRRVLPVILE